MKERYIKDKISSLSPAAVRMERERKIAVVANNLNVEIERATQEFQRKLMGYVCQVLNRSI